MKMFKGLKRTISRWTSYQALIARGKSVFNFLFLFLAKEKFEVHCTLLAVCVKLFLRRRYHFKWYCYVFTNFEVGFKLLKICNKLLQMFCCEPSWSYHLFSSRVTLRGGWTVIWSLLSFPTNYLKFDSNYLMFEVILLLFLFYSERRN